MTTRLADTQFSCVKVASCYRVCGTSSSFITQTCNISNKIKLATKLPSFNFMWVCELKQWKEGKKGETLHERLKLDTQAHMACQLDVSCHCGYWSLLAGFPASSLVFIRQLAKPNRGNNIILSNTKRGHVYFVSLRRSYTSNRRRWEKILFEKCCTTMRTRFHILFYFLLPQNETHKLCCINHSAGPKLGVRIMSATLFWKI